MKRSVSPAGGIEEVVREEEITATQLSVPKRLDFFPGISRAELSRQTFISSQAAQVALSTPENKGLVVAHPTRNRRAVRTQLTAKGKRVRKRCRVRTEPVLEKVVAPLDGSERKALIELLRQLVEGTRRAGAPLIVSTLVRSEKPRQGASAS